MIEIFLDGYTLEGLEIPFPQSVSIQKTSLMILYPFILVSLWPYYTIDAVILKHDTERTY